MITSKDVHDLQVIIATQSKEICELKDKLEQAQKIDRANVKQINNLRAQVKELRAQTVVVPVQAPQPKHYGNGERPLLPIGVKQ